MTADRSDADRRNLLRLATYQDERLGRHAAAVRELRSKYLRSARDGRFGELLEGCLASLSPNPKSGLRDEAVGIVLLAGTGAGKSRLIRRNVRKHELFQGFMQQDVECPAVGVRCLQAYTLRVLATEILAAAGYPVRNLRENKAWADVRDRLHLMGVLLLWVDEVNNLLTSANERELTRILNSFKAVLNHPQWPVVLVLSGTPECEAYLRRNPELCRRMRWMTLDSLTAQDIPVLTKHVTELCQIAHLSVPEGLMPDVLPRLIHAAGAQFGISVDLAIEAIGSAIASGATAIETEHFARAYAFRTQAAADANPFVTTSWEETVPLAMPNASADDRKSGELVAASTRGARRRLGLA